MLWGASVVATCPCSPSSLILASTFKIPWDYTSIWVPQENLPHLKPAGGESSFPLQTKLFFTMVTSMLVGPGLRDGHL